MSSIESLRRALGKVVDGDLNSLLQYSATPLQQPILKLPRDLAEKAVRMHSGVLEYTEGKLSAEEASSVTIKIMATVLKRYDLVDELYLQLIRQTRGNPNLPCIIRCWTLMGVLCGCTAPAKDKLVPISEYIHAYCNFNENPREARQAATRAFSMLKRSAKAHPRKYAPTAEELEAYHKDGRLVVCVNFLDNSFEELPFDIATSMREAVMHVAKIIDLQNYSTFALFERRSFTQVSGEEFKPDVDLPIDDKTRLADVIADARNADSNNYVSRLLFKKRIFRESDEDIEEPVFLQLSYLQAQAEYLQGIYPVERRDAVKLCVLQILEDELGGPGLELTEKTAKSFCERFIQAQLLGTKMSVKTDSSWAQEVARQYNSIRNMSRDEAREEFIGFIRNLPYGNALFYLVQKHSDPLGLLPEQLQLAVNRHGLHFFRPKPKEYLHSVELRDIMQFGSSTQAVFFKMRMAGELRLFQFATRQGEDICLALQTHIHDVLARRIKSKHRGGGGGNDDGGLGPSGAVFASAAATKQIKELQTELEQWRNKCEDMQARLDSAVSQRRQAENAAQDAQLTARGVKDDETRMWREQALKWEAKAREQELLLGATSPSKGASGSTAGGGGVQDKLQLLSLSAARSESLEKELVQTKKDLDEALALVALHQERKVSDLEDVKKHGEHQVADLKAQLVAARDKCARLEQNVGGLEVLLSQQKKEQESLDGLRTEATRLQEEKGDLERQLLERDRIVDKQAERLEELEALYKNEQHLRKKYHNTIEDMKGKIRVYARVRPILRNETTQQQTEVLNYPDRFTLAHPWKDSKKPKSYEFDTVFTPNDGQEAVFEDTKHLVQSAVDGYNVCIFAYGQTGSGKTHTIYGGSDSPGLTPRAVSELFRIIDRDSGKFTFEVNLYMLELYQDQLTDLLAAPQPRARVPSEERPPPKLEIKKDFRGTVVVHGSCVVAVKNERNLMSVVKTGLERRTTASTNMNHESSRSHLIIGILVTATNLQTQAVTSGKISLVDLAGSERIKKSGSTGEQLKEAQSINKSLSALGDVISALAADMSHIPYRNHKLTMLMSDSLGGNAKTLMFVNVSPTDGNLDETQQSLAYATRARTIKNSVGRMELGKDMLKLKKMVDYWKEQAGLPPQARDYVDLEDIVDERMEREGGGVDDSFGSDVRPMTAPVRSPLTK